MAIFQATKKVTEGSRALALFTDRYEACERFIRALNVDPPPEQIWFFHGDGGNGKSLLLYFLYAKCCMRLSGPDWGPLNQKVGRELVEAFQAHSKDGEAVPWAYLDFGMPPRGEERPQEAFAALLMLRRQLSAFDFRFPLYDFAILWYLYRTNQLTEERMRQLLPAEEIEWLIEVLDNLFEVAGGGLVKSGLTLLDKHLKRVFAGYESQQQRVREWWTVYRAKRGLNDQQIAEIQGMDPQKELIYQLPALFAQDLNVAMTMDDAPKRVVLFFDAHEAFWGQQRHLAHDLYFVRDEWLRQLLGHLEFAQGIVAICAGREAPRWHEAAKWAIPTSDVVPFLIGHFEPADAREFLQKAQVQDVALQEALIRYTSVTERQIHPFFLGLSVDILRAAEANGQTLTAADFVSQADTRRKERELVHRLLRYVDDEMGYAIRALAACRAFDYSVYRHLGQQLGFPTSRPIFDRLTRFSFVWAGEKLPSPQPSPNNGRGSDWWRIHDLLRRLFAEQNEATTRQAHPILEAYYRQQSEQLTALIEAIYHLNQQDWEKGVNAWIEQFAQALELARYEHCEQLLTLRRELQIENDFYLGYVSYSEGKYLADLARHDEARQEYQEAIAAYLSDLARHPESEATYNNLGLTYLSLGQLQSDLAQHEAARISYQASIDACKEALRHAPDYVNAQMNLGITYSCLGQLQSDLAQHESALKSYQASIDAYQKALHRAPDYTYAHNNLGIAYRSLGQLQSTLAQHEAALVSYQASIDAFQEEVLRRAPDYTYAHGNLGNTYLCLGELQSALSQHEAALVSYQASINAYQKALRRAPDDVKAHINLGNTYLRLGELQSALLQYEAALGSYQASIDAYQKALCRAPDDIYAHNNLGNTYLRLGQLQSALSQHESALESYQASIDAYQKALRRAPDDTYAHTGLGLTCLRLGELLLAMGQKQKALLSFGEALASWNRSLAIAPNDDRIRGWRDGLQAWVEGLGS